MPALENEFVDTALLGLDADVGPNWLREMLPGQAGDLAARGDLILEFVVEEPEQPEALVPLLEVCAPMAVKSIADYAMLKNPVPVMTQGHFQGGEMTSLDLRAVEVVELAFENRIPRNPYPVVRPARVFHTDSFLLLVWRGIGMSQYRLKPRSEQDYHLPLREFPGTIVAPTKIDEEIERGVPEKQARFATEWGGRGPAHFDAAVAMFDGAAFGPRAVAEKWIAAIAEDMQAIAGEELPLVHEQWELDLQEDLANSTGDHDHLRSLAMLGTVASIVDGCRDGLSEPRDHGDPHWFTKTSDSPRIERALAETERMLDRFSVRQRDLISLASAISSAMALRLQQQNQRQSESLQAAVTTITSVVAGPALVFGVFGANVPLPLGTSWWGLGLMVFLAAFSAFAIRWALNRLVDARVQRLRS